MFQQQKLMGNVGLLNVACDTDMSALDRRLDGLLQDRKGKGRFRQLREYDESSLIDFVRPSLASNCSELTRQSSNDYLSLTHSSALRQAFLDQLESSPQILGSTGSRLLSGSTSRHTRLEHRFGHFFDSPAALLFNSGWDANVSFFATVPQPGDWVVHDELVHASVHSGLRASRVDTKRRVGFKHNDPDDFQRVLQRVGPEGTVFVALESLYSMDGDFAPLPALLDILDQSIPKDRQCVVLDEAHSTGVYGDRGRGVTHALHEQGRVGVRLMTFGKAVGSSGGGSASPLPLPLVADESSRLVVLTDHPLVLDQLCPPIHLLDRHFAYRSHRSTQRVGYHRKCRRRPGESPSAIDLLAKPHTITDRLSADRTWLGSYNISTHSSTPSSAVHHLTSSGIHHIMATPHRFRPVSRISFPILPHRSSASSHAHLTPFRHTFWRRDSS